MIAKFFILISVLIIWKNVFVSSTKLNDFPPELLRTIGQQAHVIDADAKKLGDPIRIFPNLRASARFIQNAFDKNLEWFFDLGRYLQSEVTDRPLVIPYLYRGILNSDELLPYAAKTLFWIQTSSENNKRNFLNHIQVVNINCYMNPRQSESSEFFELLLWFARNQVKPVQLIFSFHLRYEEVLGDENLTNPRLLQILMESMGTLSVSNFTVEEPVIMIGPFEGAFDDESIICSMALSVLRANTEKLRSVTMLAHSCMLSASMRSSMLRIMSQSSLLETIVSPFHFLDNLPEMIRDFKNVRDWTFITGKLLITYEIPPTAISLISPKITTRFDFLHDIQVLWFGGFEDIEPVQQLKRLRLIHYSLTSFPSQSLELVLKPAFYVSAFESNTPETEKLFFDIAEKVSIRRLELVGPEVPAIDLTRVQPTIINRFLVQLVHKLLKTSNNFESISLTGMAMDHHQEHELVQHLAQFETLQIMYVLSHSGLNFLENIGKTIFERKGFRSLNSFSYESKENLQGPILTLNPRLAYIVPKFAYFRLRIYDDMNDFVRTLLRLRSFEELHSYVNLQTEAHFTPLPLSQFYAFVRENHIGRLAFFSENLQFNIIRDTTIDCYIFRIREIDFSTIAFGFDERVSDLDTIYFESAINLRDFQQYFSAVNTIDGLRSVDFLFECFDECLDETAQISLSMMIDDFMNQLEETQITTGYIMIRTSSQVLFGLLKNHESERVKVIGSLTSITVTWE